MTGAREAAMVATFQRAWHAADERGETGARTIAGIRALEGEFSAREQAARADQAEIIAKAIIETPWEVASTERPPNESSALAWMRGVDSACRFAATIARQSVEGCACPPCPGRGRDGHGLTHCAECCFGTGVEADIDCPTHGERAQSVEGGGERG